MSHGKGTRAAVAAQGQAGDIFSQAPGLTQFSPFDINTGFGNVSSTGDSFSAFLNPQFQGVSDSLTGAGQQNLQGGAGFMQQGGNALAQSAAFDPFAGTETIFNRFEDILNPARQRQRLSLQDTLLGQGRLGSSGGALTQQSFEEAVNTQQMQNLAQAFQQAQGANLQQANIGSQLFNSGFSQQQLGGQQFQGAFGLQQGILSPLSMSAQFGDLNSVAGGRTLSGLGIGLNGTLGAAGSFNQGAGLEAQQSSFGEKAFALGSGVAGGLASGVGQGLGAGMLAFSDHRLKENVHYIGNYKNHKVFSWSWKENSLGLVGSSIGVIAQLVQEYMPDVVTERKGYLTVDYGRL